MQVFKTKMPFNLITSLFVFILNLIILWFFIFHHHPLASFWVVVNLLNLLNLLAIISGWRRSVLMLDERRLVICRPAGWRRQTNIIINLYEVNHVEFNKNHIIIGRNDSTVATMFGPIKNINLLHNQLKQYLPKIVL